jgi:methyl-accepting chemotaxis protein
MRFNRAFLLFALTGVALIVATIVMDFGRVWSVVLPLLPLISYAVFFQSSAKRQGLIEEFADSVYYMGFLYTLVALAVNLSPELFGVSDQAKPSLAIAQFGLALVSTIVGLTARIVLTQFASGPSEVSLDDSVSSLAGSVETLRGRITDISEDIRKSWTDQEKERSSAHKELLRGLEGELRDLNKRWAEVVGDAQGAVGDVVAATKHISTQASKTGDALGKVQEKIEGFQLNPSIITQQFESSAAELEIAISTFAQEFKSIRIDGAGLTDSIKAASGEIAAALAGLSTRLSEFEPPRGVIEAGFDDAATSIRTSAHRLSSQLEAIDVPAAIIPPELEKNLQQASNNVSNYAESVEHARLENETLALSVSTTVQTFGRSAEALSNLAQSIEQGSNEVATAFRETAIRDVLAEVAGKLNGIGNALEGLPNDLQAAIARTAASLQTATASLQELQQSFESNAGAMRNSAAELSDALVESADLVTGALRGSGNQRGR